MTEIRKRRIYVASSWRNALQPSVVEALRAAGHEVYDFRNPAPGNHGFSWSEIDPEWKDWDPETFNRLLSSHPVAASGFASDKGGLEWCDTCILVLPCGRSAHLELGYAAGQGKDTFVLLHPDKFEPELMYLLNTACSTSIEQIIGWMAERQPGDVARWFSEKGGHFYRPYGHALRLLREVVELCVACGSGPLDISEHVCEEMKKAQDRGEFGGDPSAIRGELADCALLVEIFAKAYGVDLNAAMREKLDVIWSRECEPGGSGALYRKGGVPEVERYVMDPIKRGTA